MGAGIYLDNPGNVIINETTFEHNKAIDSSSN